MNTKSNSYVMVFTIGLCVTVSSVLAVLATELKETQLAAAEFDRQKNVMMAAGLIERGDSRPRPELEALYKKRVKSIIVDTRDGSLAEGDSKEQVVALNAKASEADLKDANAFRMIETGFTEDGRLDAIILPVSGKGLWSTLYGYLALDADKNHVKGIQFYKHGETPGLGGEIENPEWTAMWKGKEILNDKGELVSVTVKKGKVNESIPSEVKHYVDGLAGATITSNGVSKFVLRDLQAFSTYLQKK
ncbi:MAG TPA: NADH:ubiquinone reductase (Na(+)-transporting) subunit C [Planctomycetes bacterium]|nr:NADH:ubiquinone reductase (Na(+)-transporting) subunit C [Planctomycetota bacterium]